MRIKTICILLIFLTITSVCSSKGKVIHVFVALCDNKSQGIVPVPAQLGNGEDPRNNLYWGAMYGIKTYFNKSKKWKLLKTLKNHKPEILERVVFKHIDKDYYLIADAYRGKKIRKAIIDFLSAAGGKELNSDLVVYIGHNGLMDFEINPKLIFADTKHKQHPRSIVLACKSQQFFAPLLRYLRSKPVLLTTGFMAPEAYSLESALDGYISGESDDAIKERAAQAYNKYQKCGIVGARKLFYTRDRY